MNDIAIYVAGSSMKKSNGSVVSGFGSYLSCGDYNKTISAGFHGSTAYRMELRAVVHALSLIKERSNVVVYCRNSNVVNLIAKDWLKIRIQKNRLSKRLNADLCMGLYLLCKKHNVRMVLLSSEDNHYKAVSRLARKSANDFDNHYFDGEFDNKQVYLC